LRILKKKCDNSNRAQPEDSRPLRSKNVVIFDLNKPQMQFAPEHPFPAKKEEHSRKKRARGWHMGISGSINHARIDHASDERKKRLSQKNRTKKYIKMP